MKRLMFLATMIVATTMLKAQVKVSDYQSTYWPDKTTYDIEVSHVKGKIDRIWIQVKSLDRISSTDGYLLVDIKKLPDFIELLQVSKGKYEEWLKTAKENKIEELTKEIPLDKRVNIGAAFKYGKWQFDYSNNIRVRFLLSNGKANLIFSTGELQSSSNQFIKNEGLVLVFNSSSEIQSFIDTLNIEKFIEIIKSKETKEDLFK